MIILLLDNRRIKKKQLVWEKNKEKEIRFSLLEKGKSEISSMLETYERIAHEKIKSDISLIERIERQRIDGILTAYEQETKEKIQLLEEEQFNVSRLSEEKQKSLEELQRKYDAVIVALKRQDADNQQILYHMLEIPDEDKKDIAYLLDVVALELHHPEVLTKLVWSEFILKPVNDLLNRILPEKTISGIYKITNLANKKVYVGRANDCRKRLIEHFKGALGISSGAEQEIHRAMKKDGIWSFSFEIIEQVELDKLAEREKYYIEFFQSQNYGYNRKAGDSVKIF